jgi:hypothetical protein
VLPNIKIRASVTVSFVCRDTTSHTVPWSLQSLQESAAATLSLSVVRQKLAAILGEAFSLSRGARTLEQLHRTGNPPFG